MMLRFLIVLTAFCLLAGCTPSVMDQIKDAFEEVSSTRGRELQAPFIGEGLSGTIDKNTFGGANVLFSPTLPDPPGRAAAKGLTAPITERFPPPDQLSLHAIELSRCKDLRVRELTCLGFKVGVYAKNCDNLVIEDLQFEYMFRQRLHSTPDREDTRDWLWPHSNDNREWMTNYGACIVLENCKNCVIRNCSARGTQNGIILDKCEGCQVYNNDFSYCSGWGCALWRSSKNTVAQNRFEYCVRG